MLDWIALLILKDGNQWSTIKIRNIHFSTFSKVTTYLNVAISMLSSRTLAINKYTAIMPMTSGWAKSWYFHVPKTVWFSKRKWFSLFCLLPLKYLSNICSILRFTYFIIIIIIKYHSFYCLFNQVLIKGTQFSYHG